MIAVMGAGGNVGGKVADLLLHENVEVRVFEHKRKLGALAERGAEVVSGDAINVEDLKRLFEDADAALVLLPEDVTDPHFAATRSDISRALARALREQPVDHVVALSAVGADRADAAGPPAGLHEYEKLLFGLEDANILVLRSASYMDYLLANMPLIQSQHINGSALAGDLKFPMIATQDVASEAAERLMRRDFTGHGARMLLGPEDVSMREATYAIGAMLDMPELPYLEFPPADMKNALIGAGMSEEAASLIVDMQLAVNEGRFFDGVRRTAETTTPTKLEDFLQNTLSR
jgi:uncharacterized protein YbjT (DUF2867 family)